MRTTIPTLLLLTGAMFLTACPEPVPTAEPSGGAVKPGGDAVPSPGGNAPNSARWEVGAGEGVKLTGTFDYEGTKTGRYRLDFRAVPTTPGPPSLVHTLELREPGEWSVSAPVDAGLVEIIAFIDIDGDGPTPSDPAGITVKPVEVGSEPVSDIAILVKDEADETVMNPRARWPDPQDVGTAKGPVPDGPPPSGGPPADGPPPDGPPPDGPAPDGPPPEGAGPEGAAPEGATPPG